MGTMSQDPGTDPTRSGQNGDDDPVYGTPPDQPPGYHAGHQRQPPPSPAWRRPNPNGPVLSDAEQRQWAMIAHLGGVLAIVPVIALLPSLLIFAAYGSRGDFLRDQAREALNFQVTVLITYVVARILSAVPPFPDLIVLVWAFSLIFSIIGAMSANRGQRYRYPLTFRFIN
jgi:uncharacterized protein